MHHQPLLSGLTLPPARSTRVDLPGLRDWPEVSAETVCRHAKQLGAAGEAIFDSQMLCFGELCLPVGEFFAFDRLLLREDGPVRVQVKTVILPSGRGGYVVEPRKGYRGSPRGMRPYGDDDFDLLAIVILREGVVVYATGNARQHHVPVSAIPRLRRAPRASFDAALAALQARATDRPAPHWLPSPSAT